MKKYLICSLLILFVLVGCNQTEQNNNETTNTNLNANIVADNFSVNLFIDKGGWSFNTYTITIDDKGNFKYINDDSRIDEVDETIEGKLTEEGLDELINYIVFEKKFFRVPTEFEAEIYDARITTLEVKYNGEEHTVTAVSMQDDNFRQIEAKIIELKDKF